MKINGIAHIFVTARDFEACRNFYGQLLPFLGLTCVADVPGSTTVKPDTQFKQGMPGLHHVCFRARERADVDAAHGLLIAIGAVVVHPPREDKFAPGYYSVLFEDPDGIRLEINHVPGRGLFEPGIRIGAPYSG